MSRKRKQVLIDRPIQFGLVFKVASHWLVFLLAAAVLLPFVHALADRDFSKPISARAWEAVFDAGVMAAVFVLLLPYFIYDFLKTSNRFAGPMYRLREAINTVRSGGTHRPIKFRDRDFWYEVADEFNEMIEVLQSQSESAEREEERESVETLEHV